MSDLFVFAIQLTDEADTEFVQDLLLELAAQPGVTLVMFEGSVVAPLPSAPALENGE